MAKTMYPAMTNSPGTELSADITVAATTITVINGNALPAAPNLFTIGSDETAETVMYAGKSGDNLTGCTRGFDGTTAKGWATGAKVARYLTAYDINTLKENVEGISTETINKISAKLVGDLPGIYPVGISVFSLSAADSEAWKSAVGHSGTGDATLVETSKITGDYVIVQRVTFSNTPGVTAVYERTSLANNSWTGAWVKLVARSEFDKLGSDVAAHLADYVRQPAYAQTAGTATAYTVSLDPAPAMLPDGFGITIVPHVDSGASPTLKINSNATIGLKKQDGTAAEMKAGKPYTFRKVGSDFLASSGGEGVKINGQTEVTVKYGEPISAGDPVFVPFVRTPVAIDQPSQNVRDIAPHPNGQHLAVGNQVSKYLSIYYKNNDYAYVRGTVNVDVASMINSLSWSEDGNYLYVGVTDAPYFLIYKFDAANNTLTKLAQPSNLPGYTVNSVFVGGGIVVLCTSQSPYIHVYTPGADTITKVAQPAELPSSWVVSGAFSVDGSMLALSLASSPYLMIYKVSNKTLTKLANPATMPTARIAIAFSDNNHLYYGIAMNAPPFNLGSYLKSGDTLTMNGETRTEGNYFTKLTICDIKKILAGIVYGSSSSAAPFNASTYGISKSRIEKLPMGDTTDTGSLSALALSPDGRYLFVGASTVTPSLRAYMNYELAYKITSAAGATGAAFIGYAAENGSANETKKIMAIAK
ncbi:WD40 repeat domain-containing protein [Paenibacillus dokdonensis]|uniref:WD40 repeat domain-containing protein n=1 Tax=Paenibacillus dokdonensis TaxID=2567944 RepID=A0ABU6GUG9_9BACL|nr:WD40 repeat domain-containing protein [Paenibacillus dokdonensis]MEC0241976.1 WD40 repeat domain-containing protein [Paenibacillus dokdonensis]